MAYSESQKYAPAPQSRPYPITPGSSLRLNLVALALLASGATQAQTAAGTESGVAQLPAVTVKAEQSGSAEDGYLVKSITGVGIWGERSLQDTPYSMSIISGDLIENVIAKDMNQIFKMNPTTQETASIASDATDNLWVTMRGFQVNFPIINGIPYASRIAGTPMMQDIERVEIINGATGFLYGGGRVGGAVNYVTKKPTIDTRRSVSAGSYGGSSYFGHAELSGQFDDNNVFGYRFSVFNQGGETSRKEEKKQKAVSLVFDWKPTDNFYADLRYSYKDTEAPGPTIFWATGGQIDRSGISRNRSHTPDWLVQEFTSNRIESGIRWDINEVFTLRTNLLYEEVEKTGGDARMRYLDRKVLATSWFGNYALQENEKKGISAYLDSKFETFGISHTLTVGYSSASDKTRSSTDNSRSYQIPTDMTLDEFRNYPKPGTWGSVGQTPRTPNSKVKYDNILIGDDIVFNERWSALVGFNYATTMSENYRSGVKYDESALTPTLSLMYKPFNELTTYATYIESLEAGAVVGSTYLNENEVLDPYISKQYEIGAKYTLNDRVSINSALFRIEKANAYDIQTTPKPTRTQDGEQVHQGIELGITGKVTDDLTIIAGGTLMDLSIDKATNSALEGKKPTGAARVMAKIYAEYSVPTVRGLSVSGGAYYTGKKYQDDMNTDVVPSYTLFDAGLRYTTRIGQYPTTFNFSIQNITDEVYWSNSLALGDPRTFSFSVRTAF